MFRRRYPYLETLSAGLDVVTAFPAEASHFGSLDHPVRTCLFEFGVSKLGKTYFEEPKKIVL